jgi:hypothetical protein
VTLQIGPGGSPYLACPRTLFMLCLCMFPLVYVRTDIGVNLSILVNVLTFAWLRLNQRAASMAIDCSRCYSVTPCVFILHVPPSLGFRRIGSGFNANSVNCCYVHTHFG